MHVKIILVCFFDHEGITHYKSIAQGQTVNQQCYFEMLTRLWESVRRKRPELLPDKLILHHDNDPAYDGLRVREFLAKKFITKMGHPPYSPDLALRFLALSKIKYDLKGRRFADIPGIQHNVTKLLRGILENDF
jgi:histone-lysine N-methyltransferase SETMAR